MRVEHIGDATLYLGDCLEILPTLPKVDAVVTDPPYGIGKRLVSGGSGHSFDSLVLSGANEWDVRPAKSTFATLLSLGVVQIIWGGNFFELPPCEMPLCWDKVRPNQKNVSEFEYAWTSMSGRARKFSYCANGGFVAKEDREHPTQKPVALMAWCVGLVRPEPVTVFDPFMGSGTTGVACANLGRKFIGIEIEPKYFDIACRRIEDAQRQGKLFEPAPQPQQVSMLEVS
jgi:site-specific DNA-methyltransferase (adenine-specific)/modification methylase